MFIYVYIHIQNVYTESNDFVYVCVYVFVQLCMYACMYVCPRARVCACRTFALSNVMVDAISIFSCTGTPVSVLKSGTYETISRGGKMTSSKTKRPFAE